MRENEAAIPQNPSLLVAVVHCDYLEAPDVNHANVVATATMDDSANILLQRRIFLISRWTNTESLTHNCPYYPKIITFATGATRRAAILCTF